MGGRKWAVILLAIFYNELDALVTRFIYELFHRSNLPWVYGGEYEEFGKLAVKVVEAWIKVGLKIYLVFDGASCFRW